MISSVKLFYAGYCTHPERIIIRGGKQQDIKIPAIFGLIKHSQYGNILYDTGYSERFYSETSSFPNSIYAKITPVYLEQNNSAKAILEKQGVSAQSINYIIISHFHADHIGGLRDFANAKFVYDSSSYDAVKNTKGLKALRKGFLKGMIPEDFLSRSLYLSQIRLVDVSDRVSPFSLGYDLFEDGSIVLIKLPGHARGQIGTLVRAEGKNDYFFIADAAWQSKSYKELIQPSKFANFIMDNCSEYTKTLKTINEIFKKGSGIKIIPSHCMQALEGELHG